MRRAPRTIARLRRSSASLLLVFLLAPPATTLLGASLVRSFCPCSDSFCCKGSRRPESATGRHCDGGEGATQMRCHHPEPLSAPPALGAAVLPAAAGERREVASSPVSPRAESRGRPGFAQVVSPPPELLPELS